MSPHPSESTVTRPAPEDRLIPLPEVRAIVSFGTSRIYELMAAPTPDRFPPPVKVGRSSRWLASEVHAWVARQVAATRAAPVARQVAATPAAPATRAAPAACRRGRA